MRNKVKILRAVAFVLALVVLMGAVHPAQAQFSTGSTMPVAILPRHLPGSGIVILTAIVVTTIRVTNWGLNRLGEWMSK